MNQVQNNQPIDLAFPEDAFDAWAIVYVDVIEKLFDNETHSKSLPIDAKSLNSANVVDSASWCSFEKALPTHKNTPSLTRCHRRSLASLYQDALDDEPDQQINNRLRDLLSVELPSRFLEVWNSDVHHYERHTSSANGVGQ